MKSYKIHLLRHGLTEANKQGIYAGCRTDVPLCEEGKAELMQLREQYDYPYSQQVYLSPMLRCRETADILYPDVPQVVVEDLREADFGEFDGKKLTELEHNPQYQQWVKDYMVPAPPGGESIEELSTRVGLAFRQVVDHMTGSGFDSVAIVCHGGVIMNLMFQFAYPKRNYVEWAVSNGVGYTLNLSPSLWMRDGIVEAVGIAPHGLTSVGAHELVEKFKLENPDNE